MEKEIISTLEKKYQTSFELDDHYFEKSLNTYVFTAHPLNDPRVKFEGNFDERQDKIEDKITYDAYPNMKFSQDAEDFYESLFPNKQLKHVTSASVHSKYEHEFGSELSTFDEYLENRIPGSTIRMNTYFFDIPDRPYHQIVVTIRAILEELQLKYKNDFSLFAGFWPVGFLEDKKLEDLTFGFESTTDKDADNLIATMQYLAKVLFIKITSGSVDQIEEETLFELIKEDNKNGPNEMVEL